MGVRRGRDFAPIGGVAALRIEVRFGYPRRLGSSA